MIEWRKTEIEKTYHVIQVIDSRQAGVQKLEDVKEVITRKLKQFKKLDAVKADAEKAFASVSSFSSLKQADSVRVKSITDMKNNGSVKGIGQDYVFTNKVFASEINKINGPIRGENGYYIFEVINKNIPSDQEIINKGAEETISRLRKSLFPSAYMKWFREITDNAQIEDNRIKFWSRKY